MKRASYREACAWIAANESPGDDDANDPNVVSTYPVTMLIADLFGVDQDRVAADIVKIRQREFAREARADRMAIVRAEEAAIARHPGMTLL